MAVPLVIHAATGLDQAMNILMGLAAIVIGALGFWQRHRISQLNRGWNKRMGKPGEMAAEVGTANYFGMGAIFMILAGVATVIYSLVTGQMGGSNDRTTALMVIIIAAVGFVVLGVVFAVMLFKRRSKQ
jgi:drug/metabolite transporter (DMT)-like permease